MMREKKSLLASRTNQIKPVNSITTVYVCSPYRAKSTEPKTARAEIAANIDRARGMCRLLLKLGYMPVAPHLFFPQFLDECDVREREEGMQLGAELLKRCDELWAVGDEISEGMAAEIASAEELGIVVRMMPEPQVLLDMIIRELTKKLKKGDDSETSASEEPKTGAPIKADNMKSEAAKKVTEEQAKIPTDTIEESETVKISDLAVPEAKEPAISEASTVGVAVSITLDDITKVIVTKIKKDRKNNEKIGSLLTAYGVKTVKDLPEVKYEVFLNDLAQL